MAKTKIHILRENPVVLGALPHLPLAHRSMDAVSRGWNKAKKSNIAQKVGRHWKSGEAKVDRFASPVYKAVNKGIKGVNDFQWAHRGIVRKAAQPIAKVITRLPGGEHVPGASFIARKPRPPKIHTRHVEYGIASLADDAAAVALAAGYEPEGEIIREEVSMNENLRCAIDRISAGANQDEAREFINASLGDKVLDLLDAKKQQIAQVYFSGVTEEEVVDESLNDTIQSAVPIPSIAKHPINRLGNTVKGGAIGAGVGAVTGGIAGALGGPLGVAGGAVAGAKIGGAIGAFDGARKNARDDEDEDKDD